MTSREEEAAAWFARMRGPDAETHRAAFEAWRDDRANADAYAQAEIDWLAIGALAPADRIIRTAAPARRRFAPAWAVTAALLLAVALGATWQFQPSATEMQRADTGPIDTPTRLADGSRVVLMDGARIETRFDRAARRVILLSGRARFIVAHDAVRPFSVFAAGSETIALGTVFEVDIRSPHPRVTLIRGSVEVRASKGVSAIRLVPGERAEVTESEARRLPTMSPPVTETMLDAQDLPLGTIIELANRNGGTPIHLADPALASRRITGRFDIADSAALARKLAAALNLDLRSDSDGAVLDARTRKRGE